MCLGDRACAELRASGLPDAAVDLVVGGAGDVAGAVMTNRARRITVPSVGGVVITALTTAVSVTRVLPAAPFVLGSVGASWYATMTVTGVFAGNCPALLRSSTRSVSSTISRPSRSIAKPALRVT